MITRMRTATISEGKLPEALGWAVEVANYVNNNFAGVTFHVRRNIGGALYQVHWVSDFESLASYAEVSKQIEADAGYQKLLAQAREERLLVSNTIADKFFETIS